jgi:hypothetical protein
MVDTMTGTDIVTTHVRPYLRDTSVDPLAQTWTDTQLLAGLNMGRRIIGLQRPSSMVDDRGRVRTHSDVSALTGTLPEDDFFLPALVEYVIHYAYGMDAGDKKDKARALVHLVQFWQLAGLPSIAFLQYGQQLLSGD